MFPSLIPTTYRLPGFGESRDSENFKTLGLPSRRPYGLLKRGAEDLFLQGCAAAKPVLYTPPSGFSDGLQRQFGA